MEALLKRELGLSFVKATGQGGGGCINEGLGYSTDKGKIYAKINKKKEAKVMFDGELACLEAILATDTVRAPKPMKVMGHPTTEGAVLAMEYLDMRGLNTHAAKLGEQLARMHQFNEELLKQKAANESRVGGGDDVECITRFGFPVTTCCGIIPQDNEWCDDWVAFYSRNRLKFQLGLIERDYGDREARELWPQLERRIPGLFEGLEIKPALLHGDLWGGNVAEMTSEPVIFDPASFYGHSEYELGIAGMFGGFNRSFYSAYHKLVPKAAGFDKRHELYKLFHYLNHWNHFGSGYRGSSISIMKSLIR
ncbi:ketosamine-3-kinase-like [Patiria miniata]|uniref:protein-ribulosamine 3-kinase n=1 Tax=Patiria miniata TaxID=46514 RepID=A0A914BS21_PATMI|nr:ketosamine-3-kinase-like [Patiria miniata]XP_038079097.1 ketosamine-3-kinase-like [Patiria miniata]XP_038079098.1 ketosamine-3-kinase-like [Patiria miniata]